MASERQDQSVQEPPNLEDLQLVQLVHAAAAGSREALDDLIGLLTPGVLLRLWSMVGSREDVEDLAQITFIKMSKAIAKYQPTHSPRAWVYRIAHNTAIDFLRKRALARARQRDLNEQELELLPDHNVVRQDREAEAKVIVFRARPAMYVWVKRYLPGKRHRRVRQAISMVLDGYGPDWFAIAQECGYRTPQSAKNSVTSQLKKALFSSHAALSEARLINAELQRHDLPQHDLPQSILFLGLIDLDLVENSHEKDNI